MPDDVLKAWREAGSRGAAEHKAWGEQFAQLGNRKRAEFERRIRHERPASLAKGLRAFKKGLLIRTTGDIIALSPPLIIEKSHIDQLVGTLADVLKTAA